MTRSLPGSRRRRHRFLHSEGALPNLVVIGAQKCGTTALHAYLAEHPDVSMSRPKELNFFATSLHRARGADWYSRHFDGAKQVRGEASTNYTAEALPPTGRRLVRDPSFTGVPERMHALIPDARLIYLVRDPIDRIRSQWNHLRSIGQRAPLESVVSQHGSTYLARSSYCFQLERFLERYALDQILVIDRDDLLERRFETLATIFRFLGVDDSFWSKSYEQMVHVTTGRQRRRTRLGIATRVTLPRRAWTRVNRHAPFSVPFEPTEMSAGVRTELADRLSLDVARFRALTGRRFEHWSL